MKSTLSCVVVLALVSLCTAEDAKVTPVQKVIELLTGMLEKGKAEKHEEEIQFAAYKQWCDDTTVEKRTAIADAQDKIEHLKADIQKFAADAEQLAMEITQHNEDIAIWTGDIKSATRVRVIEKADYVATHKDYSESVEAIQMAIAVLKKQAHDRKQKSFVQVAETLKSQSLIPDEAKRAINTFLAQDSAEGADMDAPSSPEANAYEFQSHGIIEMLEKLLDKFIDERTSLEKEEMDARHAFDMLIQDLKAQIASAEDDVSEKSEMKAKKLQAKADAEGSLTDTVGTMEADKKYLADMSATCEQKGADFESRQALRAEELGAIEKAKEIISSGAVAGSADKHLPALLQTKGASLSQLRADARSPTQERAAAFLRDRARNLNSRVLAALSVHVADDPFRKVKKMIKDLIVKLLEQANEEAEHKGWCDTELSTNEQTRKEKTAAVETLHAEIDELSASIAKLTQEITDLTAEIAAIDKAVAEATEIREAEKAENTQTIKDAQEAQTAVSQAVTVLKEFYAKAAEATSFVQQPEVFDEPYKGMGSESGGVVGMLEVIESDFARLEADTKAAEASAQKEYDEFMTDSEV